MPRLAPCQACGKPRQVRANRKESGLCGACYRPPRLVPSPDADPAVCSHCGDPRNPRRLGSGLCRRCYGGARAIAKPSLPDDNESPAVLTRGQWVRKGYVYVWRAAA